MNTMSLGEFKRLRVESIEAVLPLGITVEGAPAWVITRQEDVIVVKDLHIRVRNMLRMQEKKARMGMDAGKQIFADDVQEPMPTPVGVELKVVAEEIPRTPEDGYSELMDILKPKSK